MLSTKFTYIYSFLFSHSKKKEKKEKKKYIYILRQPGIEPGPPRWQRGILTTELLAL